MKHVFTLRLTSDLSFPIHLTPGPRALGKDTCVSRMLVLLFCCCSLPSSSAPFLSLSPFSEAELNEKLLQ